MSTCLELPPLKWTCICTLPQIFLKFSLRPLVYRTTIWMLLCLLLVSLVLMLLSLGLDWDCVLLCLRLFLDFSLLRAHVEYLQLDSAF